MPGKDSKISAEETMTLGGSQTRFWGRLARGEYSEEGQTWFFHWNLDLLGP